MSSEEEWFYVARGSQQGPVSLEELKQKKQDGSLADSDLVWKEGFAEWLESKDVPELAGGGAPAPAASAAPEPAATPEPASAEAPAFGAPTGAKPAEPAEPAKAAEPAASPAAPAASPMAPAASPMAPAAAASVSPSAGVSSPTPLAASEIAAGGAEAGSTPGIATASLICGILIFCFGLLAAIPAVILGHMSLKKIKESGGTLGGKGFAKAGLILGYIGIVLSIIWIVYFVSNMGEIMKEIEKAQLEQVQPQ